MTLVISVVNDKKAILVADRRITHGQHILHDEFNKIIVFVCRDARLAIAFTGLATFNEFNTCEWLTKTISEICINVDPDINLVISHLESRASQTISTIPVLDKRLTIIMTGFVYHDRKHEPRTYIISNFENGSYTPNSFTTRSIGGAGETIFQAVGQTSALPATTIERLQKVLESKAQAASLVRFTVKHLQNAATNIKSLNKIGEHCTAVIINSAVDSTITTTYHTTRNANKAFGPNIVIARGPISFGSEIMSASILAGPNIRKQDPCWCGSGKPFKHCHMRKYGGIYMKVAGFNEPLASFFAVEREVPWPSGRIFNFRSDYA